MRLCWRKPHVRLFTIPRPPREPPANPPAPWRADSAGGKEGAELPPPPVPPTHRPRTAFEPQPAALLLALSSPRSTPAELRSPRSSPATLEHKKNSSHLGGVAAGKASGALAWLL